MVAVTADQVKRRIIFDSMADPQMACLMAGLVGVSEEGQAMEIEESQRRLYEVGPLIPGLMAVADWMADVATNINVSNLPFDPPEDFVAQLREMLNTTIQGSLVATFSVFRDLGMISIPGEGE